MAHGHIGTPSRFRRTTWRTGLSVCLLGVLASLAVPASVLAQEPTITWPHLVLRGGAGVSGAGNCGRTGSLSGGAELRTRGRWIVSGAVDLFTSPDCLIDASIQDLVGTVYLDRPWTTLGPRVSLGAGPGFTVLGTRTELTGVFGVIRTRSVYDPAHDDAHWQPWYGATLTLWSTHGVGIQYEEGRQRLEARYRDLDDPTVLLGTVHYWERMYRIALTLSIG